MTILISHSWKSIISSIEETRSVDKEKFHRKKQIINVDIYRIFDIDYKSGKQKDIPPLLKGGAEGGGFC
jgi:hypothetical protein